ncbi:T9SS type A sorting domain-containing protein [Hymenobacter monticola]|uniref:Lamin tail domain-containing protein n=1 Tax=Hymenobacter monticola TaxID=1705399 RepID=A0ABY4AZY5_9BACT|nr:T9SS type A sorting domain-containing protein [Hymenobacter monticola]UOE32463.1 lamin tail domain-containing protein [Hymenobacter monticola]
MKHLFTAPAGFGHNFRNCVLPLLTLLAPALAYAQAPTPVISEIYGGGGATGAPYLNDFVELYNPGNVDINLGSYSLQYAAAAGTSPYSVIPLGNLSIPAHGYFLIQLGSTTSPGAGATLTAPDVTNSQNISATAGRLALVSNTTALVATAAANAPGVVDFVGYGSGVATFEGASRATAPSNTTSIERKARASSTSTDMAAGNVDADQGNGYDSDNNNLDFVTRSAPGPQNSASPTEVLTPIVYYSTKVPGGFLNDPNTFSSTLDGTGPAPTSFSSNFLTFVVVGANRTIDGDWTVSGTNAKVLVQSNATFVVPASFNYSGPLDLSSDATLVQQNAAPAVTFGTVDVASTVTYAQASGFTVPILGGAGYGNLTLRNASKSLSTGTTVVRGNLLVDNVSTAFGGAAASASVLNLGGNLTLAGTVAFGPAADNLIQLSLTNTTTAQVLDGGGSLIKLFKLSTAANQAGSRLADGTSNLELGNDVTAGGGYNLASGTVLAVGNNTLSFASGGKAVIGGSVGVLALSPGSNLIFSKNSTTSLGTLRLLAGSTQLNNFTLDAVGNSNTLALGNNLTVNGTLAVSSTSTLSIGAAHVLTLNGPVSIAGILRGAADADLVIGGAGALDPLEISTGLGNFTLNRAGATALLLEDLTVNSALTLTDGVLSIGANVLTLNGAVTSSATGLLNGTVSPANSPNSSLTIGGSGALGNVSFTSTGGVLNNFNLNRPGGTLTITGNPLQIAKPTLTSGILGLGAGAALTITGALAVADPTVALFAGTPTSVLNFTGSGAIGSLAFVPGQDQLRTLSLVRPTGTIPTVQLLSNLTVNTLALSGGRIFVQGTAKLQVLPGGSLVGGSATSYTNTLTLGAVTNSTTPTVSLSFPLGVNGQYRPLAFTVTDQAIGTTSYTAHQYEAPSPTRTLPATLARVSQIRYYNVVQEAGGTSTLGSATIRLNYAPTNDLVTPANVSFLRVAMTDPADDTKWKDIGGAGTGNDITSASFAPGPLGDFTLATDITTPPNTNPLPVELTRFEATRQTAGVALAWATATERNSARFEVERSLDGNTFAAVLSQPAQGNSTQAHEYAALDAKAPAGRLYYRLRQVDQDGTVAYSKVVTVAGPEGTAPEWTVYPNPTTDRLTASLAPAEGRTYRILNTLGQVVGQGNAATADPTVEVRQLPAGTYFLELRGASGPQTRRFVKND